MHIYKFLKNVYTYLDIRNYDVKLTKNEGEGLWNGQMSKKMQLN